MTRSRILDAPRVVVQVADGRGWLAPASMEHPPRHAVQLDPSWNEEDALAALSLIPAWRLLDASGLELGSRVLVLGGGWLRDAVERLARLRGALAVERGVEPEAVILASGTSTHLEAALQRVIRNGVVAAILDCGPLDIDVYPDLHRRGLRLRLLDPCELPRDWPPVRRGLSHLIAPGQLER